MPWLSASWGLKYWISNKWMIRNGWSRKRTSFQIWCFFGCMNLEGCINPVANPKWSSKWFWTGALKRCQGSWEEVYPCYSHPLKPGALVCLGTWYTVWLKYYSQKRILVQKRVPNKMHLNWVSVMSWSLPLADVHFSSETWKPLMSGNVFMVLQWWSWRDTYPPWKTKITPENGWLEDDCFLLGWLPGRCYGSFRNGIDVYIYKYKKR